MTLDHALKTLTLANASAVENGTPVAIPQDAALTILRWHYALGRERARLSVLVNRRNKRVAKRAAAQTARAAKAAAPVAPTPTPADPQALERLAGIF